MRKSRKNIALIELLIVIFFFSLSAMIIVQVFTQSKIISQESKHTSTAIIMAQDIIEQLQASPFDADEVLDDWVKTLQDGTDTYTVYLDNDMQFADEKDQGYMFIIKIEKFKSASGDFFDIHLFAYTNQNKNIFTLNTGQYISDRIIGGQ